MRETKSDNLKTKPEEKTQFFEKAKSFSSYKITKDYDSVYYFLKDNGFSENFITNLRKVKGYILIDNQIATTKSFLPKNATLSICNNPNQKTTIMHCILPLDIVYEDAYYLLVNKPSGISTMPNRSHYSENLGGAICHYLQNNQPDFTLRILNRLDKDTSGLVLVTKNSIAQKDIKNIEKTYLALCEGVIDEPCTISKPILTVRDNGVNQQKRVVSEQGQAATTFVLPIKTIENTTLLSITLKQGRTHQIRLHLSSISHPLVGDALYGKASDRINHAALCCNKLSFYHPYLKKKLSFSAPLPQDFLSLI